VPKSVSKGQNEASTSDYYEHAIKSPRQMQRVRKK
jgi:hypothetical protein